MSDSSYKGFSITELKNMESNYIPKDTCARAHMHTQFIPRLQITGVGFVGLTPSDIEKTNQCPHRHQLILMVLFMYIPGRS